MGFHNFLKPMKVIFGEYKHRAEILTPVENSAMEVCQNCDCSCHSHYRHDCRDLPVQIKTPRHENTRHSPLSKNSPLCSHEAFRMSVLEFMNLRQGNTRLRVKYLRRESRGISRTLMWPGFRQPRKHCARHKKPPWSCFLTSRTFV